MPELRGLERLPQGLPGAGKSASDVTILEFEAPTTAVLHRRVSGGCQGGSGRAGLRFAPTSSPWPYLQGRASRRRFPVGADPCGAGSSVTTMAWTSSRALGTATLTHARP